MSGINFLRGWKWLSEARETSKRWIPGITRFALLRWAVNEDDDEWLARRGQSRQKKCALCANQGRSYPLGGFHTAICETCIATKQLTAFTVNIRGGPLDHLQRNVPADEKSERQEDWENCVACNQGDNTIGHWVRWCTVPIFALRELAHWRLLDYIVGRRLSKRPQTACYCLTDCPSIPTTTPRSWSYETPSHSSASPYRYLDQQTRAKSTSRTTIRPAHAAGEGTAHSYAMLTGRITHMLL